MPDLDTIVTEELVDELLERCDSLVMAYDPKSNKGEKIKLIAHGEAHKKVGLVYMLLFEIKENLEE